MTGQRFKFWCSDCFGLKHGELCLDVTFYKTVLCCQSLFYTIDEQLHQSIRKTDDPHDFRERPMVVQFAHLWILLKRILLCDQEEIPLTAHGGTDRAEGGLPAYKDR